MIINFIIKYIKKILDFLIIGGLIVAFAYFDPFGWFKSKTKIQATPLMLTSIRDIGQLITAEYYGEAIASIQDTFTTGIDKDAFFDEVDDLITLVEQAVDSLRIEKPHHWWEIAVNNRNIERRFKDRYSDLYNHPLFSLSIQIYTSKKTIKDALWELGNPASKPKFNFDNVKGNIYDKYSSNLNAEIVKSKNQLVYIGRGVVRAGIDFGSFNENNIWYNQFTNTVYVRNTEPKILNCDINPWFIPEQKIKGYELVRNEVKRRNNPLQVSINVKNSCLKKLRNQAIKSGIITSAKENATQTLKELFTALLDKPIKDVVFITNKYDLFFKDYIKDSLLTIQQAATIAEITNNDLLKADLNYFDHIQTQMFELMHFNDLLKKKTKVVINWKVIKDTLETNNYSLYFALLISDGKINQGDSTFLYSMNDSIIKHQSTLKERRAWFEFFSKPNNNFDSLCTFFEKHSLPWCDRSQYLTRKYLKAFSRNKQNDYFVKTYEYFWQHYTEFMYFGDVLWFSGGEDFRKDFKNVRTLLNSN